MKIRNCEIYFNHYHKTILEGQSVDLSDAGFVTIKFKNQIIAILGLMECKEEVSLYVDYPDFCIPVNHLELETPDEESPANMEIIYPKKES